MCFWDEEKVELESTDEIMQTFFVRVDSSKMSKEAVENVFGKVSFVENLEYNDERFRPRIRKLEKNKGLPRVSLCCIIYSLSSLL